MIAYSDTSWLLSYLNEDDENHAIAPRGGREVGGARFRGLRGSLAGIAGRDQAGHASRPCDPVPEHVARRVINRFHRAVTLKPLLRKEVDMKETVAMALAVGETHGWQERHTTFDLWHLAAAWSLSARCFSTFDQRQEKVAGPNMGMSR